MVDTEFEKILSEDPSTGQDILSGKQHIVLFLIAFFVSSLPAYIHCTNVFGLDFYQNAFIILIINIIGAVFLTCAYEKIEEFHKKELIVSREASLGTRGTKSQREEQYLLLDRISTLEAIAYSIFFNNTIFLFWMIILSAWILPKFSSFIPTIVGYSTSVLCPSALSFMYADGYFGGQDSSVH